MPRIPCRVRRRPLSVENLEIRLVMSADYAPIDGFGNNVAHPEWGSAETQLLRQADADYADGISAPAGADRVSAREISNGVSAQSGPLPNERLLTDFVWQWGQFLDHDLDLTEGAEPAEPFPIDVPSGDPSFDPMGTGTQTIDLNRSVYDTDSGTSSANPRQQINQITAFIDGSNVYGSDHDRADALRTFVGGRLATSAGDLLPFNTGGLPNAGGPGAELFLAGDVRANEQAGLTSMHTLFVREHNRLADQIAADDSGLNDEQIYQAARQQVIAQLQIISFREFLPALLGPGAIDAYAGYDSTVNPQINNEFANASYRFGHSMLPGELLRLDAAGNPIADGNLPLRDAFFAPDEISDHGIDSLLRGLAVGAAQEVDTRVIDDVRNFLFGPPGSGGFDLVSLNIQRGRDHGLPGYNEVRVAYGLPAVSDFDQVTSDAQLALDLDDLYGSVDEIDAWVGGLAENHLPGGSTGPLVTAVLVDQFTRLRDGDRFWYQSVFSGDALIELESTTLADVIERNTTITGLQENVFFDPSVYYFTATPGGGPLDVTVRAAGGQIEIVDRASGDVLDSRATGDVEKLVLVGSDGAGDRITLEASLLSVWPTAGVDVSGGYGAGDTLIVHGTAAGETITIDGPQIDIGGHALGAAGLENLNIHAGGGNDRVEMTGSAERDIARMGPGWARLELPDAIVLVDQAETIRIESGGGNDLALLDDSEGDDTFVAYPTEAWLEGDGFRLEVAHFARVDARGLHGGDNDRAFLHDGAGHDRFVAHPTYAYLVGDGFFNFVRHFDRVEAHASDGYDKAQLYDSALDDRLVAWPTYVYLTGDGFFNYAGGFDRVDSFASAGGDNDRAFLHDSTGDELLYTTPIYAYMRGDSFMNYVKRFDRVDGFADAGGANDRAYMYDSSGDDLYVAHPTHTSMSGEGFVNYARRFPKTYAYALSGENDRAYLYDSDGNDRLLARPEQSSARGDDYFNFVKRFDKVYAYFLKGGDDRADVQDAATNEQLLLYPQFWSLNSTTSYIHGRGFERLHAISSEGGHDVVKSFDRDFDPIPFDELLPMLDYVLELEGDWVI